jgi:hypothetical protein
MKKYQRQIRQLVEIRLDNTNLAIYPEIIADRLNCPLNLIEDELVRMEEEGILRQFYEMRCDECGTVIDISEKPFETGGQVECLGCSCQMESASMNPVVNAYIRVDFDYVC